MELNTFPYILRRSRRRSIALAVDPTGAVRVLAPLYAPRFWIERVVQKHWSWVVRRQTQITQARVAHPTPAYISGEQFPVWGIPLILDVQYQAPRKKTRCARVDDKLCVYLPAFSSGKIPAVKDVLREWYRQETECRIAEQIQPLAARMGVSYRAFKAVHQKSRWGSCSRQGNLRFNGRLALFPPAALEYVIVHELAHMKEANHSARFWAVVASVLLDFRERRRLLSHTVVKNLIHCV